MAVNERTQRVLQRIESRRVLPEKLLPPTYQNGRVGAEVRNPVLTSSHQQSQPQRDKQEDPESRVSVRGRGRGAGE